MAGRTPFPTEPEDFKQDNRISFDRVTQTFKLDDETGQEWEWSERHSRWVPLTDEALVQKQQEIYKVAGVDENEPAMDPRKRKASDNDEAAGNGNSSSKKQKAEEPRREKKNSAIYITSLPDDVTEEELHEVFSRYGVIAESAEGDKPRIKLYLDNDGNFKGDALVVYFRPESVQLAIDMLDETDFRHGEKVVTGPMRVQEADPNFKKEKEQPVAGEQAKKKGTGANHDRQKIIKKTQEMNNRLADWDDDDPSTIPDTSSRWDKVVVLRNMFRRAELEEDPGAILEIKEDVREECEKFGAVTNVVLYDKESSGVVTVRFANATAAKACIKVFDGRSFDKRRVEAYIATGKERFKKTRKDADDDEEEARLEGFSKFIESEEA